MSAIRQRKAPSIPEAENVVPSSPKMGKRWFVYNWGWYGWAETIVKFMGMWVVLQHVYLSSEKPLQQIYAPALSWRQPLYLVAAIANAVLLTMGIFDRFLVLKEVFAMFFVLINTYVHWLVVLLLAKPQSLFSPEDRQSVLLFCIFFIVGDVIKLAWLKNELHLLDEKIFGRPKPSTVLILWGLVILFVLCYAISALDLWLFYIQ